MESIAHIFWGLTFGGIETMLINIANEQVKLGAEVHVIIINEMCEPALLNAFDKRIHVSLLHRKKHSKSIGFILRLNLALIRIKPDHVHLHSSSFYSWLLPAFRKKACATLHALPCGEIRIKSKLGWAFQPIADIIHRLPGNTQVIDRIPTVFSISQAVHDSLLKDYGVNSIVVNNGIIVSNFKKRLVRTKSPICKIVQVGRLDHSDKGQDLTIQAIAKLAKQGISVSATFIGDGQSLEFLKQLAEENRISDNIFFIGKRSQAFVSEHICDYDIFVQPSRFEGFGLTVAEAMAAGVPVIVANDQGPAEVTKDNTYGWTFLNGDQNDFAEKIEFVINHYKDACTKANAGLKYVAEIYDVSITAKKYLEKYGTKTKVISGKESLIHNLCSY